MTRSAGNIGDLEDLLDRVGAGERALLEQRLRGLRRRQREGRPVERALPRLRRDLQHAATRRAARAAQRPALSYDPSLPITACREQLVRAIRELQVVVVAGETGSGKSTQLPKLCLEAGRGVDGMIGCTQPRRIAARSLAERLCEELDVPLGGAVGYQVRFTDRTAPGTRVKFMTDGILLAETQGDERLGAYDTLILDEAHERSLNIDFLLGYLRRLLPERPDFKLLITSATIDTERFSRHFGDAPVVEVSGRGYPVEVRYRPLGESDGDLPQGIASAVAELGAVDPSGDILVFLSGERDIREAADALRRAGLRDTEILPLYGRLSAAEQHRVFHPGPRRRVVLATNVAETSLTVPRIRFVVDSGLARISRYSPRSKIQRLPIEPVSRASAEQRAGRCGRLGPGVCVRLYAEEDFQARPEFTEPEILRTSLASVILRMRALRLGEIEDFPFLEPPDRRQVNDGYQLLFELGALDEARELTDVGRTLARLPVDPRLGRMLLEGAERGCLQPVLTLVALLSIQDPRERPAEAREQADAAHAAWSDPQSDFAAWISLWDEFVQASRHGGSGAVRRWCRERFLAYNRMREWREIRQQLAQLARELKLGGGDARDRESVHRALLAGLVTNVGRREEKDTYQAPRQRRFNLHPGSGLARKPPRWVMSAALVETARLFARDNAAVEPDWIEQAAPHLVQRQYFEPHYERRGARVYAYEQVSLYGLVLREKRRVHYGPVDPREARSLFITHALVRGEYDSDAAFLAHNRALVDEIRELEHKQRRHDLLESEAVLQRFFDERLPADVHTGKAFERWRRRAEAKEPRLLFLDRDSLMRHQAVDVTAERFPETLASGGAGYPLEYRFEPGHAADGVTVSVPLHALNTLDALRLEWLVPGLIRDKVEALIKGLPKSRRRHFVPVPDYVQAVLESLEYAQGDLYAKLARELARIAGVSVDAVELRAVPLPAHLETMRVQVLNDAGDVLGAGRDLVRLQEELGAEASRAFSRRAGGGWRRDGMTRWECGQLPESVPLGDGTEAWVALVDQDEAAGVRLFEDPAEAQWSHHAGLRRLLMLSLRERVRYLKRNMPVTDAMCLHYAPVDRCESLREDFLVALLDRAIGDGAWEVRNAGAFEALVEAEMPALLPRAQRLGSRLADILQAHFTATRALEDGIAERWPEAARDVAEQLAWLVWPGFLREVPAERLAHYPRYFEAARRRLEALPRDPHADDQRRRRVRAYWEGYLEAVEHHGWPGPPALERLRWMIEEYRVSLFAQPLGTAEPVSPKRLDRQLESLNELA